MDWEGEGGRAHCSRTTEAHRVHLLQTPLSCRRWMTLSGFPKSRSCRFWARSRSLPQIPARPLQAGVTSLLVSASERVGFQSCGGAEPGFQPLLLPSSIQAWCWALSTRGGGGGEPQSPCVSPPSFLCLLRTISHPAAQRALKAGVLPRVSALHHYPPTAGDPSSSRT